MRTLKLRNNRLPMRGVLLMPSLNMINTNIQLSGENIRNRELEDKLQCAIDGGDSVWIIGDIHGYKETFLSLLNKLDLKPSDHVICIGDLIDKGPDSKGVLEFVRNSKNIHSIRGNHEEMLRLSVSPKHGRMMKSWLKYGGLDTLASFSDVKEEQLEIARSWLPFIESLPTEIILRDFRIVHAGYNPEKSIEDQHNQDLMWSRQIFDITEPIDPFRQIIVGHTPVQKIVNSEFSEVWNSSVRLADGRPAVIAIDTGVAIQNSDNARLSAIQINLIAREKKQETICWQLALPTQ